MVGSGCSVLPCVCYAGNDNLHICHHTHSTLLLLTHLLCIPSVCHFPHIPTHDLYSSSLCLVCSFHLQIIPHHPILLFLFPILLFSMMKNLVTLCKGLLKPPKWCLNPPLSLSILPLRLGSCFQRGLCSNLSLQPRLQCYPPCMVQLGRFLIFLPLHLHPVPIKQVTLKYLLLHVTF